MPKAGKKPGEKAGQLWCECDCANCDIGAHERCSSPKCHMPKWKEVQKRPAKKKEER